MNLNDYKEFHDGTTVSVNTNLRRLTDAYLETAEKLINAHRTPHQDEERDGQLPRKFEHAGYTDNSTMSNATESLTATAFLPHSA